MSTNFWNWQGCRTFIEEAVEHYKAQTPPWFTQWLDDLYIRLGDNPSPITLGEIQTLQPMHLEEDWEAAPFAVNRVYKFLYEAGRDTTGMADH